ncbi:MAG: MFS transporter, partial [Thiotrichales bacterium]|nr:MFS transporter [Thiotrichales bacterium]
TSRAYTATQYALMASLGNLGRTTVASFSGVLVDGLNGDWFTFFLLTALMAIPALLLLWRIGYRLR